MPATTEKADYRQGVKKCLEKEAEGIGRMVEQQDVAHQKCEQEVGHQPAEKLMGEEGQGKETGARGIEDGEMVEQAAKVFADDTHFHAQHGGRSLLCKFRDCGDARFQNIAVAT